MENLCAKGSHQTKDQITIRPLFTLRKSFINSPSYFKTLIKSIVFKLQNVNFKKIKSSYYEGKLSKIRISFKIDSK